MCTCAVMIVVFGAPSKIDDLCALSMVFQKGSTFDCLPLNGVRMPNLMLKFRTLMK